MELVSYVNVKCNPSHINGCCGYSSGSGRPHQMTYNVGIGEEGGLLLAPHRKRTTHKLDRTPVVEYFELLKETIKGLYQRLFNVTQK